MCKATSFFAVLLLILGTAAASEISPTRDGVHSPRVGLSQAPVHVPGDREVLVNDGSFEDGTCAAGSAWTCTTNTGCDFIVPFPEGYGWSPAYDGINAAWLGGFCGDPNTNSFCQEVLIDGTHLDWFWEGWVNDACSAIEIYVDGNMVFDHWMDWPDNTAGTGWTRASESIAAPSGADLSVYAGTVAELCLVWNRDGCGDFLNDNMLVDYLTFHGELAPMELVVNPDGSGDVPNLQQAVNEIAEGGTIYLGNGVFTGPDNRYLDSFGKNYTMRSISLNPEECIIDCGGGPPPVNVGSGSHLDPSLHSSKYPSDVRLPPNRGFIFSSGEGPETLIRGIGIEYAYMDSEVGGGVLIESSSPTFEDCTFHGSYAVEGGAVYLYHSSSNFTRCRFINNAGGFGGATVIAGTGSNPSFIDCSFVGNLCDATGGAVDIWSDGQGTFEHCQFRANTGSWGGGIGIETSGNADIRHCTFTENSALEGGGIWASAPTFRCWFTIISYSTDGGACWWMEPVRDLPDIACCDFAGNVGGNWIGDLAPLLGTDGNFDLDPQYCGPIGSGNIELQSDSPCLAANNDCGQLIGALPEGCDDTVARSSTWGEVKSLY